MSASNSLAGRAATRRVQETGPCKQWQGGEEIGSLFSIWLLLRNSSSGQIFVSLEQAFFFLALISEFA